MYFYPTIGKNGRLGNQMFQYATLFALAKHHGVEAGVPIHNDICTNEYDYIHIYDAFPNLSASRVSSDTMNSAKYDYVAKEDIDFNFDPSILSIRDDCRIKGYFQSELYFNKFSKDIRKEFSFSDEVNKDCHEIFKGLKLENGNAPLCAVHFRRGDYTNVSHVHTNLDAEYYNPAFSWMNGNIANCRFLAFSDDYEWCKNNLPNEFILANTPSMFHDMLLMSMCDAHIIANSSFSWWGAWLANNSKQVIAPKKWFGPSGPKRWDTTYCSGWGTI